MRSYAILCSLGSPAAAAAANRYHTREFDKRGKIEFTFNEQLPSGFEMPISGNQSADAKKAKSGSFYWDFCMDAMNYHNWSCNLSHRVSLALFCLVFFRSSVSFLQSACSRSTDFTVSVSCVEQDEHRSQMRQYQQRLNRSAAESVRTFVAFATPP
jgi:hypothetical protein